MSKYSGEPQEEIDINMTPMLDIVFIMLIFFIVTAVFVKASGVEVVRPEASTARDIKRVSVIIGVGNDNKIWINKRQVEPEDVAVIVSKLKSENPKGKVVIKADARSHAGTVISIVEELNRIGIPGVSIAARKGE